MKSEEATASSSPVFIVGANRSGTTLLRLILNAHARIGIPEELVYLSSYVAGVPLEQWRAPGLSEEQYARFVRRFLASNCGPLELNTAPLEQALLSKPPSLRRPYRMVLEAWARCHGKARWGEKTPGNLFFVDVMLEMFPAAQFIYLARDPRAGVHSMNRTDFLSEDTTINALNRRHYATNGLALLEGTVPADQRMTVRYEDLVREPEATTRALCSFLDETYEPAMLHFHQKAERYMKQRAAGTFNQAATRPIDASRIDAWKEHLSRRDVSIIEAICHEEMERFGYVPNGTSPSLKARLNIWVKTAYYNRRRRQYENIRQYLLVDRLFERSRWRLRRLLERLSKLLAR